MTRWLVRWPHSGEMIGLKNLAEGPVSTNFAETVAITDGADNAKRRQIMAGPRELFLAQGFDAASMVEIARKAGVLKGTLYVYFESKEQLFEAIATAECDRLVERVFLLDSEDHDVEAVLTRLGCAYFGLLSRPEAMAAVQPFRNRSRRYCLRLTNRKAVNPHLSSAVGL